MLVIVNCSLLKFTKEAVDQSKPNVCHWRLPDHSLCLVCRLQYDQNLLKVLKKGIDLLLTKSRLLFNHDYLYREGLSVNVTIV